jgi:hypothetical protein
MKFLEEYAYIICGVILYVIFISILLYFRKKDIIEHIKENDVSLLFFGIVLFGAFSLLFILSWPLVMTALAILAIAYGIKFLVGKYG